MRQVLVAGNWKMNGSKESIRSLLDGVKAGMADVNSAEVAVCAPAIYIPLVEELLAGSAVPGVARISRYTNPVPTRARSRLPC
jgi:triosephosphate isomerase